MGQINEPTNTKKKRKEPIAQVDAVKSIKVQDVIMINTEKTVREKQEVTLMHILRIYRQWL